MTDSTNTRLALALALRRKRTRAYTGPTLTKWDVYETYGHRAGNLLTTVYFDSDMSREDVYQSLTGFDKMPTTIRLERNTR